jgi:hypothetical protein
MVGRRMPDRDLQTADGPTRAFTLRPARPGQLGKPGLPNVTDG